MSHHPLDQLDPHTLINNIANSSAGIRRGDKFREFWARLSLPSASPLLSRVQNIQYLEYELHKFKLQRLEEAKLPIYISPMAKANLQSRDDELFPLEENVQAFLASDRQVMLILGDSGAGKSTFNKHL
ncbi:hypothetical protein BGZ90_010196, partial [Linnemannia elongata]